MDITETSESRFNLGIERFLAGEILSYNGVVFYSNGEQSLHIFSYSDWAPEQAPESHAKEKIARAKAVLEHLMEFSESFRKVAERLPHEHYFCYDYGMGAITLAKEVNAKFQWVYLP
jgi:hypothetical protein